MSRSIISLKRWFWTVLATLSFIHLFLFVRVPLSIYQASEVEHSSSMSEVALILIILGVSSLLLMVPLVFICFIRMREGAGALLIALALTYWLVDSFFRRAYPQLDGGLIYLQPDFLHLVLELVILVVIFWGLMAARQHLETPALLFLSGLFLFNSFWIARTVTSLEPQAEEWEHTATAKELFTLSTRQNLLIVLMDTFQSDYFEEVLAHDPLLAESLDGFIYFPDTLSAAPSTFVSLPAIHSGVMYDPAQTMSAYFESAIRSSSFLSALATQGYQPVLLNPIRRLCPRDTACVTSDALLQTQFQSNLGEVLFLLDISLMRSAPEFLKNFVLNEGRFRLGPLFAAGQLSGDARMAWNDSRLLDLFTQQASVSNAVPRVHFLHLMNTHPPYGLNAHCEAIGEPVEFNRKSALAQATCGLRQFSALMDKLKKIDAYDNSLIILLGDHGSAASTSAADMASLRLTASGMLPAGAARLVGSANPLLMIKATGANQKFRSDPRPAQLTDIPATICNSLQACEWATGENLLAGQTPHARVRRFMSYTWEHRFWELGYIPDLTFYAVQGPLSDWSSWKPEGQSHRRAVSGGLSFSELDDPAAFGDGWGVVEHEESGVSKRWATEKRAQLFLHLDPAVEPGTFYQLNFQVYTPGFIRGQAVSLEFNGQFIARQEAREGLQLIAYLVPGDALHAGANTVTLIFDTILPPGLGGEVRSLAMNFFSLTIELVELQKE